VSNRPTILLAGEATRVLFHDLLSDGRFALRFLTRNDTLAAVIRRLGVEVVNGGLDEAAAIRSAAKGCYGVIAAAETVLEGRTVIKVVGGSEVERFLFAGTAGRDELQRFARTVGVEPVFVDPESLSAAASIYFFQEPVEDTCRTFSLPFFL
jgi:hypothetical protein